jgi:hypothetical protein
MDITLRDYLKKADESHTYIEKYCAILSIDEMNKYINDLQVGIKNIQSVAKRMADVSNIITKLKNRKIKKTKNKVKSNNESNHIDGSESEHTTLVDPYPTENDHATLRFLYPEKSIEIIPGINIPVKIVENTSEIPISQLYYVSNLDQFAVNVCGVNIKGSLCNITKYQTENTARCEYGIKCKSFTNDNPCNYYHDPEDFIKCGKPIPDKIRNFTAGSWIYTRNKNPKTYYARHLGSKDKLIYDIALLKKVQYREEISNREGQLMHDLLLYMILNSKGLLEKYPHWK